MILALGIISFGYVFLILLLYYGFNKIPEKEQLSDKSCISFSIVVPYRNEADKLPRLLQSVADIHYPLELFEVILVDDASEDNSAEICFSFKSAHPKLNLQLLRSKRSTGSPKKNALQQAIGIAKHQYILTTDGDCEVSPNWLKLLNACIEETNAEMISGPVTLDNSNSGYLQRFQEIDFLSLQAATIGGFGIQKPFLCNAANLCFRKESFLDVGGYQGNEKLASGDDIFLMEKFISSGKKTVFLKSTGVMVTTNAQDDLGSLISQRIRWAAKTSAYKDIFAIGVGLQVFLMNFSLVLAFILMLCNKLTFQVLFIFFLLKSLADFLLLNRSARFFKKRKLLWHFVWASCCYPFFTSFAALASLFSGYTWKGRRFKK